MKIKKHLGFFIALFLMLITMFTVFTGSTTFAGSSTTLSAVQGSAEKGSAELSWSAVDGKTIYYKGYRKGEGDKSYQSISMMDYKTVKDVRTLNVYPDVAGSDKLQDWMNTYGKNIIHVKKVSITEFNKNPSQWLYKDSSGKWNYDIIVFGFWDRNGCRDLSSASLKVVDQFASEGNGVILGHDVALNNAINNTDTYETTDGTVKKGQTNFDEFAKKYLIGLGYKSGNYIGGNTVKVNNTGLLTQYPYDLGSVGTTFTIPQCHTWGQIVKPGYESNVWFKFDSNVIPADGNFYIYTENNVSMIMTGHSSGQAREEEQKILANLLFSAYQISSNTYVTDYGSVDAKAPDKPSIKSSGNNKYTLSSKDSGNSYSYYVTAVDRLTQKVKATSNTVNLNITSGLKGYYYMYDAKESNDFKITDSGVKFTTDSTITIAPGQFVHIKAVDKACNLSPVLDYHVHNSLGIDYEKHSDTQHYKYTYCNAHGSDHTQNRSTGTLESHTKDTSKTKLIDASCITKGTHQYTCKYCGYTWTVQDISAYGHTLVHEYDKNDHWDRCTSSHHDDSRDGSKIINKKAHTIGTSTVTKQETCTKDGTMKYTCKDCDYEWTETIPADGHKWEWVNTDPTNHWQQCTNQNHNTAVDGAITQNLGPHNKDVTEVYQQPTQAEKGIYEYTCKTCGRTWRATTIIDQGTRGNKKVIANWSPITYTVKFYANGGSGTMTDQLFTYDVAKGLTTNAFTKNGYTFSHWNTKADDTGTRYEDGQSIKNLSNLQNGTISLYAFYTPGMEGNAYDRKTLNWIAPKSGYYKLECWGAQGTGWNEVPGGKGGYSYGTMYIKEGDGLYISVGAANLRADDGSADHQYTNGAGGAGTVATPMGGGAASIEKTLIGDGQLKNYVNNKSDVLIVAGGGGASEWYTAGDLYAPNGGVGGGTTGGTAKALADNGISQNLNKHLATGGTQTSGGVSTPIGGGNSTTAGYYMVNGSFGQGGYQVGGDGGGSGGGGWYGGGGASYAGGGGGGSGYVSPELINAATIAGDQSFPSPNGGTEVGHSGAAFAQIKYIGPTL